MAAYDVGSKVLGGWELIRLIGQGSFGSVFEAEKSGYGVTVTSAVKVAHIPPSQSMVTSALAEGMDEESVASYFGGLVKDFMGEVALLSSLGHPGVVAYHDHEVVKDEQGIGWSILLRMELLECLTERVLREPLSHDEVLRLGEEVADVLAYCHERKIIHRDVKPENVFVDADGNFKLGDFGVSRVVEGTSGSLSQKGTLAYMAPELYRGERYDESADVYSLGLMLYRFLNSGRLPFLPAAPAPITFADRNRATARRMSGEEIPRPEGCDDETFSIVRASCAFDSTARPSAAALRDALQELRGHATHATSTGTISSVTPKGPVEQTGSCGETNGGQEQTGGPASTSETGSLTSQGTIGIWGSFGGNRGPSATTKPTLETDPGTPKAEVVVPPETERIPISKATFEPIPVQQLKGGVARPEVRARFDGASLQEDVDFLVKYEANDAPGKAKARLRGIGRFKGVKTLSFVIEVKKGTKPKSPKNPRPTNPTKSDLNAIAKRYFERGIATWSRNRFSQTTFGTGITPEMTFKAHRNLGVKGSERIYLLCDTTWFRSVKIGFACCTTGIYSKGESGSQRPKHGFYMSWSTFRKLPSEAIFAKPNNNLVIDGALFILFDGAGLRDMLRELWKELNNPENWTGEEPAPKAQRPAGQVKHLSGARAQEFLKSYVSRAKTGNLEFTTILDRHNSVEERSTRRYLSIPADEVIYALYGGYLASIYENKEPDHRLDTMAITERGLYIPKKTRGAHTVKLIPRDEIPHVVHNKIVYDEKYRWICIDGDNSPFSLHDDYFFWKGLLEGLANALA